jgi:hypothetical protein
MMAGSSLALLSAFGQWKRKASNLMNGLSGVGSFSIVRGQHMKK